MTPGILHRRRRLLGMGVLACGLLALSLALGRPGDGTVAAAGDEAREAHFYVDGSVPATDVMMLGASPREAPGETWGVGKPGLGTQNYVILRYAAGDGWTRAPVPLDESGQPLSGFVPAKGVLSGQMTPDGAGALAGFIGKSQVMLVRNPGQPFQEAPTAAGTGGEEAPLREGEALFSGQEPLIAAIEEGSLAGALVVPRETGESSNAPEPAVLHWEGGARRWTREPIEIPAGDTAAAFQPIAIAAGSPANAWLLAHVSSGSEAVSLFRREPGAGGSPGSWKPVSPGPGQPAGAPLTVAGAPVEDEAETGSQSLTVTEDGLWVDGEHAPSTSITLFFAASSSEPDHGEIRASWCNVEGCSHPLPQPEELPIGEYRSFAWSSGGQYGERVITGFPDGVILRLQGDEFEPVPTIGSPGAPADVGGSKGAAYSTADEGWLGDQELAVHETLERQEDRLEYWPAPFHKPLLAIAAQPGAPVGASSSEALAVGESGEVTRYIPGEGWEPESLFQVSGRRGEPQLHGVAWPTPNRAYAVGARSGGDRFGVIGEMWLWRGETGLWEPDPATPVNLRANLLGIAFAPGQPTRGYVVGQSGALMRYGKTWTQEATCAAGVPQPCLPAEVAGASFTSVAFAGSEALVAYRVPHVNGGALSYTGGVIANDGSGWHVDVGVAAALPAGYVPWGVAGLPDGGAALSAGVPGGLQEPLVLERNSLGSAWEPTPQPYPGFDAPASLALFREAGALRAVGSGAIPNTIQVDEVTPPPVGFPPNQPAAYPLGLATGVLRQTSTGWTDEEHERHILRPPLGGFNHWDIPYNPDPTAAILLNESGTSGWAVGGLRESTPSSETADIARYPGDGTRPSGFGSYAITPANTSTATFAVGGGAQCAAPCAESANAKLGPDVWLSSALKRAKEIHGLRAFLYAGPRVSTGAAVHPAITIPYTRELERYAALLGAGPQSTLVAATASERDHGSECAFDSALTTFTPGLVPGECTAGQTAYYAFTSTGTPTVRVIVLDDDGGLGSTQLEWSEQQLAAARAGGLPALVLGSANLSEGDARHEANAESITAALVGGGAAAYLFDAPEQNISTVLSSGAASIPSFGSGTLGYINAVSSERSDFIGASGFLLVEVGAFNSATKLAANGSVVHFTPVTPHLIPNIEELSIDANKGALLHRSEAALFSALARRPRAGGVASGSSTANESASFIPLSSCEGSECAHGILPEFEFTSSEPRIGRFVEPNLLLGSGEEVKLSKDEPIPNEGQARNYPLFCALNPGTTVVTVQAGGLSASLPVTVEPGSVRRPCGTTPITKTPLKAQERSVTTPLQPENGAPGPASTPPILPLPPAPLASPPLPAAAHPAAAPAAFLAPVAPALLPPVIVPPPLPPAAEPTPPSGTSAVSSPVEAAQNEEDEEEATESVSAQAVAYRQGEHEPSSAYLLGLIVLAAFAGASIRKRTRRNGREVRVAPATVSTMRWQRRASSHGGRPR